MARFSRFSYLYIFIKKTSVDNQITDMDRFALIMTKPMNFEDIGYHAFAQPSNEIVVQFRKISFT